jgi:hypothetical protein
LIALSAPSPIIASASSSIVSPPSTFERRPSQATATSDSFGWEEITEERRRRELEEVASPQLWEQCESL